MQTCVFLMPIKLLLIEMIHKKASTLPQIQQKKKKKESAAVHCGEVGLNKCASNVPCKSKCIVGLLSPLH